MGRELRAQQVAFQRPNFASCVVAGDPLADRRIKVCGRRGGRFAGDVETVAKRERGAPERKGIKWRGNTFKSIENPRISPRICSPLVLAILLPEEPMAVTMFDQMLFPLACRHTVVLGRLEGKKEWTSEGCGTKTDLTAEPFKSILVKDLDTALQIDL
jgi:hypothetical protein